MNANNSQNDSRKSRSPNISSCLPLKQTKDKELPKARNPFDEILAAQKEARRKAIEYKSKMQLGQLGAEAVEYFFFLCKYQEHDKKANLRRKLLLQVDDVSLVSIYDTTYRQMAVSLAKLVESRLRPQGSDGK
jgi:hypothetical protein